MLEKEIKSKLREIEKEVTKYNRKLGSDGSHALVEETWGIFGISHSSFPQNRTLLFGPPTGPPFLVYEDESLYRLSTGFSDSTPATDDDDETGDQDRLPAVEMEENLPNILSDGLGSHIKLNAQKNALRTEKIGGLGFDGGKIHSAVGKIHSAEGYISLWRTLRGVNQCSTKYRKEAPRRVEVDPQRLLRGMTYSLRGVNQCSMKYRKEVPLRVKHLDLNQKADLTLKGVVGTIINKYFPRLTQSQRQLFEASLFGILLGMHIPHGDSLLVHLMMLHEVRTQEVFEIGRFLFDIEGRYLEFDETEYILICGLKVGCYVDLLYDEKGQSNSSLRARLFPDISDARLRLKDLEDFIMSPKYLEVEDEDVVMLIQLVFVLKGLHGRDVKMCIPAAIYNLANNRDDWNRFAWGTYLWRYTSRMMRPNNQPIQVVANKTELMLPFYVRYVNWTLNHEESPPPQQSPPQHSQVRNSPPAVQSPPRRSMYKSDTCSTESATNASSSQKHEIETRVVKKKKKSSTKALVKRLLGIVAKLSSKVDRVLEEKDEPKKRFVEDEEEEEEMINEEGEETYCHDTQFDYAGLGEKVAPTPTEPSPDLGEHDTKIATPIGRPQRKRAPAWYQCTPFTVVQSTPKVKKISKTRKKTNRGES
ncbi:unnamed protein product [Lactuca saligna]|uniref:Uncharacterized protein n=1 Tax=Lactuca saligna TaxID=75948 RepID=A0AA36EL90_LACSI|nr:unnamed protein product [Lactuca saligna]